MDIVFIKSAAHERQYPPPDRPEIAFAGRSNVGKSTLINVLANRKGIARTSSKPGLTRTINFFLLEKRIYFVDLPGYGYARVPLSVRRAWGDLVENYLRVRSNLKAVVVIMDIRRDPTEGDRDLLNWLRHYGMKAMLVMTKADKLSRQKARLRKEAIRRDLGDSCPEDPILFSARTREGRKEIWERINSAISS
ncbi:MAG: YihA family ribosome biogenesis GTP-binding protein [Deltaproteobacteria bacterium]|nr:YihA family ribosome biogenesis GTP-binding protein [Deltaproteobacteria bacterium]